MSKLKEKSPYSKLEPIISNYCHNQTPHIFLHPEDYGANSNSPGGRDYTPQELSALENRDFDTRLFITAAAIEGQSVWLSTHWTDNHIHNCNLNVLRDYFKAVHATKNHTAAKSSLIEALTMCMESEATNYYSFAITVASGLSNMAENTSFQVHDAIIKSEDELVTARRKFCLMMHIVFSKIDLSRFLYDGEGSNIYRLVYCSTVVSRKDNWQFLLPLFSFLLQGSLTYFVLQENFTEKHFTFKSFYPGENPSDDWTKPPTSLISNLFLAIVTLVYSIFVATPGITEMQPAFKFYGGYGLIQLMDLFVNAFIPFVILVSGFFIIANSDSYIESVLNTAALLYIPEIDDQLPDLLGFNELVIIKNFLAFQSLQEFDAFSGLKDEHITEKYVRSFDDAIGVQFSDYYLTHWPEQGSTPENGIHFKPHEIKLASIGNQINPTNAVNEYCLIRKIVWSYTTGFESSIKQRIAFLRLEMINGQIIEINMKTVDEKVGVDDKYHQLEGVFIITTFQMSSSILRLRVCGSRRAEDFIKAFEYYCLWDITPHAKKLLREYQKLQNFSSIEKSYKMSSGEEFPINNPV